MGSAVVGIAGVLWLVEGLLVSWEMVAANNSGVSSDSVRQAQHDGTEGDGRILDTKTGAQPTEGNLKVGVSWIKFNRRDACSTRGGIGILTWH